MLDRERGLREAAEQRLRLAENRPPPPPPTTYPAPAPSAEVAAEAAERENTSLIRKGERTRKDSSKERAKELKEIDDLRKLLLGVPRSIRVRGLGRLDEFPASAQPTRGSRQ